MIKSVYICSRCGKQGDNTVIDHEAWLHHGNPMLCYDTRTCTRKARKLKKSK